MPKTREEIIEELNKKGITIVSDSGSSLVPEWIFEEIVGIVVKVKIKSKVCIRCGFNPKLKEKSLGCYHYGKKVANRHLYTYYE